MLSFFHVSVPAFECIPKFLPLETSDKSILLTKSHSGTRSSHGAEQEACAQCHMMKLWSGEMQVIANSPKHTQTGELCIFCHVISLTLVITLHVLRLYVLDYAH